MIDKNKILYNFSECVVKNLDLELTKIDMTKLPDTSTTQIN